MTARPALVAALAFALSCTMPIGGSADPRSAIEAMLQVRAEAVARNDPAAFRATVDTTRAAFRRTQQELFDMARARGIPLGMTRVAKIETYRGYTRAYVEDVPEAMLLGSTAAASYRRMYFRREGDRWLATEPTGDDLGGEKKRVIGEVEVEYWGVDEDVIDIIARDVGTLREEMARTVHWAPRATFSIRIYPTAETVGLSHLPGAAAAHLLDPRDRAMRIYQLWWTGSPGGLAPFSRFTVSDQILGMTRDQAEPRAYLRLDWWLRHGPGHILVGPDPGAAAKAICPEPLTWKQMFDAPPTDDAMGGEGMGGSLVPTYWSLVSLTTPRAFLQARSMADHLRAMYGERAYWDLWLAYGGTPAAAEAYAKALKVTPERFYSDWLTWARARC